MKLAHIIIISFVLLTAAITVGGDARPVSSAIIGVDDCCPPPCPPLCPPDQTH